MGKGLQCGIWEGELTIGHTRGEVLSLVVSASGEITALSRGLRRLPLQHVNYVHAVDTLQSCVQALHCRDDAWRRDTSRQRKGEGGEGNPEQRETTLHHQTDSDWVVEAETYVKDI